MLHTVRAFGYVQDVKRRITSSWCCRALAGRMIERMEESGCRLSMRHSPIPPASLCAGLGPFEDPARFLESGRETLELARRICGIRPDSRFLDVGCGCGRIALAMLDFLAPEGAYVGFDVNSECIDWCVEHIEAQDRRFHFEHVDVQSASYNIGGAITAENFVFPYADDSFGCAFVSSVFTHMEEGGIDRYLSEIGRVIAPDGSVVVSLLLVNSSTVEAVKREKTLFLFKHRLGPNSWTIDQLNPLDGVGISEAWFLLLAPKHGFHVASIEYGKWREVRSWAVQHDWLCLRRASDKSAASCHADDEYCFA